MNHQKKLFHIITVNKTILLNQWKLYKISNLIYKSMILKISTLIITFKTKYVIQVQRKDSKIITVIFPQLIITINYKFKI